MIAADQKRFEEILFRMRKLAEYVEGLDEPAFINNELLRDACHANLIVISEAMARMTEETKQAHPNLKWRQIIGFRNLIVHEYFRINWKTVWQVITIDLKELEREVQRILRSLT